MLISKILSNPTYIISFTSLIISFINLVWNIREKMRADLIRQASRVCAWFKPGDAGCGSPRIIISNKSGAPVYRVVVSQVGTYGAAPVNGEEMASSDLSNRICIDVLPPGDWTVRSPWYGGAGMNVRLSIEIAFIDSSDKKWIRRGYGKLERITEDPLTYFNVIQPPCWTELTEEQSFI